jgi:glycerophosphoryl diester phosphodiesterase
VIELKHVHFLAQRGHDLIALLLAELARTGWDARPELLTVECFELGALDRLREAELPARLVFLMESKGAPADEVAVLGDAATPYEWYRSDAGLESLVGRVDGISLSKRDLLRVNALGKAVGIRDVVARAHAHGLLVFTWTMRPENRFLTPGFRAGKRAPEWGEWRDEWRLILSTGIDGVFLDHPDLLAELT